LCFELVPERLAFALGGGFKCASGSAAVEDAADVFGNVKFGVKVGGGGGGGECASDGNCVAC
jgi:hypothetical protein